MKLFLSKPLEYKQIVKLRNIEGIHLAKTIVQLVKDGYDLSEVVERYPEMYNSFEIALESWINQKRGLIYVISNDYLPGIVKIGLTRKSAEDRIESLTTAGLPKKFKLLHSWNTLNVYNVENNIHHALKELHVNKEFFQNDMKLICKTIDNIIDHERELLTRRLMFLECVQNYLDNYITIRD